MTISTAIIGAGFAGIGAAIRLKDQGITDFEIFERGTRVGGTWRDNTYPGAACDIPSRLYSYSFAPNPDWSHTYSPQFVAGHLSRTYDQDATEVFQERVEPRMESVIDSTIRADIGGNVQQIHSRDINWLMVRFCQLALPIWMLAVTYRQQPFQVAINGITGEVQGRRPWSAVKITLAVIAGLLLVALFFWLYQTYGGEA